MQNIFSHIAYLLIEHECLIIPGFGALIHSSAPSKDADENVFSPPCVSLGFNSELKHNDGILADSIKREQKISYNEANKIISDFSAQLIDSLKSKKKITIPQVGSFILSEDNKVNFSVATDLSANAGQYGFKNFYLPLLGEIVVPLTTKEKAEKDGDKHVIMIPLSKRLLTAASVAAIALLFLLFSTPIDNREIPTQYAGMFLPVLGKASEEVFVVKEDKEIKESKESKEIVAEVKPATVETVAEPVTVNSNSENRYLIIIASFPKRGEAERLLPQFKKEFSSASIIEKSDRSRIYIRSFNDKEEAEYFLDKFRMDNPKHKDAWLLSNKIKG